LFVRVKKLVLVIVEIKENKNVSEDEKSTKNLLFE